MNVVYMYAFLFQESEDRSEVTPDQGLSVPNCHVKLENVDETVDEEDLSHVDHDTKPGVTAASPSSSWLSAMRINRPAVLAGKPSTSGAVLPARVPSTKQKPRVSRPKTIDEWKADPTVLSITEEGLPPGWAKIVRRSYCGRKRVSFSSPTRACIP
jgi:hypothetical protein